MKTHQRIDERSLAMARAIVEKIDRDPQRHGLARARETCERWFQQRSEPAIAEWLAILSKPWEEVRTILLDPSENGQRLRQSDPFCGILSPDERRRIYQEFSEAI
jgi:hypothetical protein